MKSESFSKFYLIDQTNCKASEVVNRIEFKLKVNQIRLKIN